MCRVPRCSGSVKCCVSRCPRASSLTSAAVLFVVTCSFGWYDILQMHTLWAVKYDQGGRETYGGDYADIWVMNRMHHLAGSGGTCDHVRKLLSISRPCCSGVFCPPPITPSPRSEYSLCYHGKPGWAGWQVGRFSSNLLGLFVAHKP